MYTRSLERVALVEDLLDRHLVVSAAGLAGSIDSLTRYQARDLLYKMQTEGLIVSAPIAPGAYTRPMKRASSAQNQFQESGQ